MREKLQTIGLILLTLAAAGCHDNPLPPLPISLVLTETHPLQYSAFSVATGDINNDSKADLAVVTYTKETFHLLLGKGDGTFTLRDEDPLQGHHNAVRLLDFNKDGALDLLVRSDDSKMQTENIWHSLFLGNGKGELSPTFPRVDFREAEIHFNLKGSGFLLVDLNNDNLPDQIRESRSMSIVLNPYSKNGALEILKAAEGKAWERMSMHKTGEWPWGIAVADLNNDGHLDIVTTNYASNSLSFLFGKGDMKFEKKEDLKTGDRPTDLAVADFNGDKRIDLAVSLWGEGSVRIYLNREKK